jgi:hypothetical protein
LRVALRLQLERGGIVKLSTEDLQQHAQVGAANIVMAIPMVSEKRSPGSELGPEEVVLKLEKVDVVLNARPCNEWLVLNKEAVDYLREYVPVYHEHNDMDSMLETMR